MYCHSGRRQGGGLRVGRGQAPRSARPHINMKMRSLCLRQCGLVFALVLMCLLPNSMRAFTLIGPRYSTGAIVQPISPRTYIMSDQLIKLPPGVFGSAAEVPISLLVGLEPSALVSGLTIAQEPSLRARNRDFLFGLQHECQRFLRFNGGK